MIKKDYISPLFTLTPTNPTEPYRKSEEIEGSDPIGGTEYTFETGFTPEMLARIGDLSDEELANLAGGDTFITIAEYNAYFNIP